ncbi:MAG: amidohydrolase [Saprospiraceae bacterium]
MDRWSLYILGIFILFSGCSNPNIPDMVIVHANIYTIDSLDIGADAIAIKDGKILRIGKSDEILAMCDKVTKVLDVQGQFVMPGFIEGHGHFMGLGNSLINLDLMYMKSWSEIVNAVKERVETSQPGDWVLGRGWHQEKWNENPKKAIFGYPLHDEISKISSQNPIVLYHASGHALFANKKAMDIVGINKNTPDPVGGAIVRDGEGNAIGIFEERAMDVFSLAYENYKKSLPKEKSDSLWLKAYRLAEDISMSKGVTSFQDAGAKLDDIRRFKQLAESGRMHLRLWTMVRESSSVMDSTLSECKAIDIANHFYTCNAIKSEIDGALGSFGAWLLEPYNDKTNFRGQNTTDIFEVKKIADLAIKHDMQLCVHAIGDRANRVTLDIYESIMAKNPNKTDLRWRVEHAQHVHPTDIPRFANNGIIASMQGIHCTSDAPFVIKRLGVNRSKTGAYAWRSFLDQGVLIASGTDTPIEDIDPIKNFYASVTRKRLDSKDAFFPEQKMTRQEALFAYTLGNAYAAKEEHLKGSITVGKLADIAVLSQDLSKCTDDDILKTEVLYTIINGKVVYKRR